MTAACTGPGVAPSSKACAGSSRAVRVGSKIARKAMRFSAATLDGRLVSVLMSWSRRSSFSDLATCRECCRRVGISVCVMRWPRVTAAGELARFSGSDRSIRTHWCAVKMMSSFSSGHRRTSLITCTNRSRAGFCRLALGLPVRINTHAIKLFFTMLLSWSQRL
ncbi:hypothetical protein BCR43DRAFT_234798 [Syncephalastrum racemosum]|uniref:Uncharacterized protein n=1 Tax=Syncephalastrum racemosum TaxID=13706 RepID=A0A1X2HEA0_SYNRA|nr:hypothetical protein BCR43DRAFT_234798 [Syncephalastrum racemosum]